MNYDFKFLPELGWSVLIAVSLFVLQVAFQINEETDWETFAISLGVGIIRSAAGAALDVIRRNSNRSDG